MRSCDVTPPHATKDVADCAFVNAKHFSNFAMGFAPTQATDLFDLIFGELRCRHFLTHKDSAVQIPICGVPNRGLPRQMPTSHAPVSAASARMSGLQFRARWRAVDVFTDETRSCEHPPIDIDSGIPEFASPVGPDQAFIAIVGQHNIAKERDGLAPFGFDRALTLYAGK